MSARGWQLALTAVLAVATPGCGDAVATTRSPATSGSPATMRLPAPAEQAAPSSDVAGGASRAARSSARDQRAAHGSASDQRAAHGNTSDQRAAHGNASASEGPAPAPAPARLIACAGDADCGYDPASERCGADPRWNRQPPVSDQGIVCYCDAGACALLRVLPVPCEGDHDCAVAREPRPHPVRATRQRPREKGRPCRDLTLSTTCERTNICTLHRHVCPTR